MHSRAEILGVNFPTYSLVALLGIVVVFILGVIISLYRKLDITAYFKLSLFGGIAAIAGAKLWYMLEQKMFPLSWPDFLDVFKSSGYSFYGGLLVGAMVVWITSKILEIDFNLFSRYLLFLVPLLHGIWKIGCFMAGCCYGVPYSGPGSVLFPNEILGCGGVPSFPVQLLEMAISIIMSLAFFILGIKKHNKLVLKYFGCYAVARFFIEFFRFREEGGLFSAAQWVSLIILVIEAVIIIGNKGKNRRCGCE